MDNNQFKKAILEATTYKQSKNLYINNSPFIKKWMKIMTMGLEYEWIMSGWVETLPCKFKAESFLS